MKAKSIIILLATSALFLFNCSGAKKEEAKQEEQTADAHASGSSAPMEAAPPQFTVDAAFQQQLAGVFTSYVSLKDAFVASDAGKTKTEAATTLQALAKADMKLLTGAAHNDWMNYMGKLESSLKEIQGADDIEAQRTSFSTLSDNLYKAVKAYGLGGTTAYYEFCPMAFNNEGAYWLSTEDKIRNPYFGDKMLTCGVVKDMVK
jgi:Cu(I)/Ag(I) efflux system membrane fusion protein